MFTIWKKNQITKKRLLFDFFATKKMKIFWFVKMYEITVKSNQICGYVISQWIRCVNSMLKYDTGGWSKNRNSVRLSLIENWPKNDNSVTKQVSFTASHSNGTTSYWVDTPYPPWSICFVHSSNTVFQLAIEQQTRIDSNIFL